MCVSVGRQRIQQKGREKPQRVTPTCHTKAVGDEAPIWCCSSTEDDAVDAVDEADDVEDDDEDAVTLR